MDEDRRQALEATTRWEPGEAEARIFSRWRESGAFDPPPEGTPGGELLDRDPAPERDRGAAHGPRAQRHRPGCADPAAPDGGAQGALDPGHRPRRDRDPGGGREAAARGGDSTATSSAARRSSNGSGSGGASTAAQIVEQYQRLGASCDYERERFTLDEDYVRAVIKVFASLYEKGLIYRDNYMVNWDPGTSSAISDLEVVNREVTDTLYEIDYPIEGSDEVLTVATVRPETMLADTAVAVNPDDERYGSLVGGHVTLPLVGRRLPVIADEHVDVEFGTGALKITPGHDPADFEIGRRHGLEEISVIGEDGRMTAAAGERFAGMTTDGGERRRGRGAARRGPDPRRAPLRALGPVLGALRRADRAADLAAVVLPHGRAGGTRDRGGRARRGPDRPRELQARLPQLDAGDSPVVRLAPALVGPSDPGLVRARGRGGGRRDAPSSPARRRPSAASTPTPCAARPTSSTPGSAPRCGRSRPSAGPRKPRTCGPSTRPAS